VGKLFGVVFLPGVAYGKACPTRKTCGTMKMIKECRHRNPRPRDISPSLIFIRYLPIKNALWPFNNEHIASEKTLTNFHRLSIITA